MELELTDIERIIALFEHSDLSELDLKNNGQRLRLKKAGGSAIVQGSASGDSSNLVSESEAACMGRTKNHTHASGCIEKDGQPDVSADGMTAAELKAPLTGVFHTKNPDGGLVYAEPGKKVQKGETVGLMEAMKMMSEIKAPVSGTIVSVEVGDADFCEYGKVLMLIQPDEDI
jgi:biotin carboxyl carrier protein